MDTIQSIINLQTEFEDLDAGGVVHHPNYIKICERARNRWLSKYGIEFGKLRQNDIALAIRSIKADYMRPIGLEEIRVNLKITSKSEKSFTVLHEIFVKAVETKSPYFSAEMVFVSANYSTGKACKLPTEVVSMIKQVSEGNL